MIQWWWLIPFSLVSGLIGWIWRGVLAEIDERLLRDAHKECLNAAIDRLTR